MALCSCDHIRKGDAPYRRNHIGFTLGDVFAIQESVFTPITDILRDPISNLNEMRWWRSQSSFNSLNSKGQATRKIRPCVVMQSIRSREQNIKPKICVIATFESTKMDALPEIFGHFCVPIFPHDDVSFRDSGPHAHSLPEWPRPNAWVIAWKFASKRSFLRHWSEDPRNYPRGQTWVFGQRAVTVLDVECESRRLSWLDKCKDPEMAKEYEEQFWTHYYRRGSNSSQRSYHYGSPRDSAISMLNNFPSRVMHARHSTTTVAGYSNQSSQGRPSRRSDERRYYHHRSASYQSAGQSSHMSLADAMYRMHMDDANARSTRGTERYSREYRDDGDDHSGKRGHFGTKFFSNFRR